MKKIYFTGTINGKQFDNENDYADYFHKLMEAGENVSAASSYETVDVDDDDVSEYEYGDDVSAMPYMEDDDPFYLDLLVSSNRDANAEALTETIDYFRRCMNYIVDELHSDDVSLESIVEYGEKINHMLEQFEADRKNTVSAEAQLKTRLTSLYKEYEDVKRKFENDIKDCEDQLVVLDGAKPVIDEFIDFYRSVEREVIVAARTRAAENPEPAATEPATEPDCKCECKCKHPETVATEVCESEPQRSLDLTQRSLDFSDIIEIMFGKDFCDLKTRHLS